MDISRQVLTYDEGIAIYTVQIKSFHRHMKDYTRMKYTSTEVFKVQDVDLYFWIQANGSGFLANGSVSVCLMNKTPKHGTFQIGDQEEVEIEHCLDPSCGMEDVTICNHILAYPSYKPDEELEITCKFTKLTTDKVVWDLYQESRKHSAQLALIETKLKEMQILQNNNNDGLKMKKPPCPICFEEMSHETKIAQCINGHLLCWNCKEKMSKNDCPSCGQPVDGRAFGMESYLRTLFGFQ